jgi:hypothetical protein
MAYSNKVSTTIPKNQLKEIIKVIESIDQKLPGLATLTDEEIAALPKMNAHTETFVDECLKYSREYPNHIPSKIDVQEIKKDVMLIKSLIQINDTLTKLKKKIEDNILLASSEAYLPCIAIYNSIKTAKIIKSNQTKKRKTVTA